MIINYLTGQNMEGNGHGLIHGTLLVSHLREVVEKRKKKEKEKKKN